MNFWYIINVTHNFSGRFSSLTESLVVQDDEDGLLQSVSLLCTQYKSIIV